MHAATWTQSARAWRACALAVALFLVPFWSAVAVCHADPSPVKPRFRLAAGTQASDPQAAALISLMLSAQQNVAVSGDQVTELYTAGRPRAQSSQRLYRAGLRGMRMDYTSPPRLAGDIQVDNGQYVYEYNPRNNKLNLHPSAVARIVAQQGSVLRRIRNGRIVVTVVGSDTVAGHAATIVQASPAAGLGFRRFWIDPTNGVQLKIAQYNAAGAMLSQSYFTDVTYNANLPASLFTPPAVSPNVKTSVTPPSPQSSVIPATSKTGFAVQQPAYVPSGFRFMGSQTFAFKGHQAVGLRYTDGITTVSVYETTLDKPRANQVTSSRAGMASGAWNGLHVVAVGSIDSQDLVRMLQSLH